MDTRILKRSAAATLVTVLALATGCGEVAQNPAASAEELDGTVLSQTAPEGMTGMIVLTPRALPAAKQVLVGNGSLLWAIDTGWFKANSAGQLKVIFPERRLDGDTPTAFAKQATFSFEKRSIGVDGDLAGSEQPQRVKGKYEIGMAVSSGQTLDDMAVVFGPSGLIFTPAAMVELKVVAAPNSLQEGTIEGYHVSHDGKKVRPVSIRVEQERKTQWKLVIAVPGFSRYDWGDGSGAHDNEGCGPWPLMPCGW